ncbi:hypothetical protein [Aquamicrobium zhengzhouense]|uniref:Uncharacterized protein n=1 Tax=Aquamicrobium zhengzhouense TaxID=2781738 RepID=A0ABS0SAU6_9HYPH|nr:hypothetical protein [Aquamicrobium zhengzhouense]MBI1620377.1 hypothetical protein [Aquamicrobium zhengzhouense]
MNRLLADTLSALNGVLAIVITIAGFYFGYRAAGFPLGGGIGALIGFLVAALCCGLISYLTLIEGHLSRISIGMHGAPVPACEHGLRRVEPRL